MSDKQDVKDQRSREEENRKALSEKIGSVRQRAQKKQLSARSRAKEEEKNYVEFRKLEVLYACRPTSLAAYRSNSDDSFPRRRRGVSMAFGERKAYYLSIRPNPNYATWFGKKKNKDDKKHDPLRIVPIAPETTGPQDRFADIEKTCYAEEEDEDQFFDDDKNKGKKGNLASNPLVKGVPFWTVTGEEEEIAEDDYPVDYEIIDKVCNHEIELAQRPFEKKKFDEYADVEEFKKMDELFDKKLLFANTVNTVLNLTQDEKKTKTTSVKSQKRMVSFSDKMSVTTFDVKNRNPKAERKAETVPLKDIVRDSQP